MKGSVLDFSISENVGAISGDDGNRYRFSGPDWKSSGTQPRPGTRVDFVGADGTATEVYLDVTAGYQRNAPAPLPDGLDERYRGLYCSSDEKLLLGLCGGIAHKTGIQLGVVRGIVLILGLFVIWIPYLIGFFLPKLPTKGVPHPG
jgi:phage shock protein PspC (stress-responsive transcriptional regulator)